MTYLMLGDLVWAPLLFFLLLCLISGCTPAQNYAPSSSSTEILRHLRTSNRDLISGVPDHLRPDLHMHFSRILEQHGCCEEMTRTPSPEEESAPAQNNRASTSCPGLGSENGSQTSFMFNF
jgi:hypothetical protein